MNIQTKFHVRLGRPARMRWIVAFLALFTLVAVPVVTAIAATQPAYDSIPSPLPGNYNSLGFQGWRTSEFGDHIALQPGTSRDLVTVDVGMSIWACESGDYHANCVTTPGASFDWPVTLNIYEVGTAPYYVGPLIATKTATFAIPYRPSGDPANCPQEANHDKWYSADGVCNDGMAFPITFDFSADGLVLPDEVIVTVTYNTRNWGYSPVGGVSTDPWNSLNVGTENGGNASVGSIPDRNDVFMYADNNAVDRYLDGGPELIFRRATGWFDYQFVVRLNVQANPSIPTMNQWGMILLTVVIGLLGVWSLVRRRQEA